MLPSANNRNPIPWPYKPRAPVLSLEKNIALANAAMKEVRSYLFFGTNTVKDCKDVEKSERLILEIRKKHDQLRSEGMRFSQVAAEVTQSLKTEGYGHCGELAQAVYLELKNKGASSVAFCKTSVGKHALVVFGLDDVANLEDMNTWGEKAVVCDAWAEQVYPASEFRKMQATAEDIRYAGVDYDEYPLPHYLAGDLIVMNFFSAKLGDFSFDDSDCFDSDTYSSEDGEYSSEVNTANSSVDESYHSSSED